MGILIFILTISFLILIHEIGHFAVAKLFGVRVEEFAFGFPPRLLAKKSGGTIFSLNLFPLGGFVKLYGEDGKNLKAKDSYSAKPWWQKLLIGIAGVFANFVFAALVLAIGYNFGLPRMVSDFSKVSGVSTENQISIIEVKKDSLAENIQLKKGDIIVKVFPYTAEEQIPTKQKSEFKNIQDFKTTLAKYKNQKVSLVVKHKGELKIFSATLPNQEDEILGVYLIENPIYKFGFFKSLWMGILETAKLIVYIAVSLYFLIKNLIISGKVSEFAVGPVGIYYLVGGATKLGFVYVLQLIAFISLNLSLINLLPIPALDGGKIAFNFLEGIRGKPINPKIENTIHIIGFIFLIILVILVFYRDILRIPYYQSIFE